METPRTIQDIEQLIKLETPESIWLDYKASPALSKKKKDEICKDVSAFANADGGMLIYGIEEEKKNKVGLPAGMDNGIDIKEINKEWIDQILSTNITPIISGIEIIEIKKTENNSFFVVNIPKSCRGPHQSPDKKYYKRYNARSAPMEHYEIEDIRNRRQIIPSLISIDVQVQDPWVQLVVENTGGEPAHDVTFIFSETFSWHKNRGNGELPNALKNGIKFFPPKRKMVFTFGGFRDILSADKENHSTYFDVLVSYSHPQTGSEFNENFYIDLNDFLNSSRETNYLRDLSVSLKELLNYAKKIENITKSMEKIEKISGATGVNLSIPTLRNIHRLLQGNDEFEFKHLDRCQLDEIEELLRVNIEMTGKIFLHYLFNGKPIEEIPGMTEELLAKIKKHTKAD
ncbi:MAG: ATP-binding protein [Candidatus Electrothrix sp. AR5]|nr:ATP-binding protein [Candidatus Electrothrix sp. AR5]